MKKIVFLVLCSVCLYMIGCEEIPTTGEEKTEQESPQVEFPSMAELEQTLADFAEVLPEALTDPELAKILYDEAKKNEADEPYALWRKIADKPTSAGITLRSKVQNIVMKRGRGKTSVEAQFSPQLWMKPITCRFMSMHLKFGTALKLFLLLSRLSQLTILMLQN